ncbi:MAG TPA: TonB-dependent receptor plug domain-containing protein, partial [Sphingomicrobium sp.]|nr:TonB-dependent receptor plug domain-containing protein [Sphingomicrobium sp.]
MKLDFRQRLLTTTLIVGVSALATPAFAQTTPPPPPNPADTAGAANTQPETTAPLAGTPVPSTNANGAPVASGQDIVITGTRIPQPNLTSASPVTVLSSQEIKLQGTTRTEDLINSLPQSFAAQGSAISNGASGTATVNLRGLGDKRTLVLVNGRRLQPGDPGDPVSDINFIPAALVKRVDVLTGGASSVYGADAVSGVVNFIMDTNFTGLRIDAQASTFMHNNNAPSDIIDANAGRGFRPPHGLSTNGGSQDISASFGTGFADGRGHILAYATYRQQDAVLEASRDYSFCALAATAAGAFSCGGSGTSNVTSVYLRNFANPHHIAGNQLEPGTVPFNYGPYNYFQRPDERYTLGTFAEYEIAPGAKPYLEAMFMNDTSYAQIAPGGDFLGVTQSVNCDNPLLSAQELSVICGAGNTFVDAGGVTRGFAYIGHRNVEGGPRISKIEHTSWRVVAGMKGDLLRGVSYDAYYQFGTTRLSTVGLNNFSVRHLNNAL